MRFDRTPIAGVWVVRAESVVDERGAFARTFCAREFAAHGLNDKLVQSSVSSNRLKGTLRGLHWQARPHAEAKLIRCGQGALFDVAVDLRSDSATFGRWFGIELTANDHTMLYIPEGCAHGFQTLRDDSVVNYRMSAFYEPASSRGVRWDDPDLAIRWPLPDQAVLSEKDRELPTLREIRQDASGAFV